MMGLQWMICGVLSLGLAQAVIAQSTATEATAYEDKLINHGNLTPDDGQIGGSKLYVSEGQPRLLRIETQLGQTRLNETSTNVQGIQLYGQLETEQYGALSLDVAQRRGEGISSHILTLRQSAMPFDSGWKASNVLGVFTPASIELARNQVRFALPSALIDGLGTEWKNEGLGLGLNAAMGTPSAFEGAQLPRLRDLGGKLAQLSAQIDRDQWKIAVTGSRRSFDASTDASNSGFIGLRYALNADSALQFNTLSSSGAAASQHGYWADAFTKSGAHRHAIGLFQFDKDLTWMGLPTTSGVSGAYYRYNFGNRQWAVDTSLEALSNKNIASGGNSNGFYASVNGRYQYSRDMSYGGGLASRNYGAAAWSAFSFAETSTRLGQTRAQFDLAREGSNNRSYQLSLDQLHNTPAGIRLSTSGVLSSMSSNGIPTRSVTLGAVGGVELLSNLSIDANLRTQREVKGGGNHSTSANLGLSWRLNSQWSLLGNYYENRGSFQGFIVIDPLTTVPLNAISFTEQGFNLVLRFEDRAGTTSLPLGGRAGDASGRIAGIVYLDANDNGRRDANESGAANISVVLDERYVVRTDKDGRYAFPLVSAGKHSLRISTEDLPLPWSIVNATIEVQVRARDMVSADFATTRLK